MKPEKRLDVIQLQKYAGKTQANKSIGYNSARSEAVPLY